MLSSPCNGSLPGRGRHADQVADVEPHFRTVNAGNHVKPGGARFDEVLRVRFALQGGEQVLLTKDDSAQGDAVQLPGVIEQAQPRKLYEDSNGCLWLGKKR